MTTSNTYPTTAQIRKLFIAAGPAKWAKDKNNVPKFSVRERNGEFWLNVTGRLVGKQRIANKMVGNKISVDLDHSFVIIEAQVRELDKNCIRIQIRSDDKKKAKKAVKAPANKTPKRTGKVAEAPKFGKLKIENCWERRTFFIGKQQIVHDSKVKTVIVRQGKVDTDVECRWVNKSTSVSDHGHRDDVTYQMLQFKNKFLGKDIWVDVEDLGSISLDVNEFKHYVEPKRDESLSRQRGGRKKPTGRRSNGLKHVS